MSRFSQDEARLYVLTDEVAKEHHLPLPERIYQLQTGQVVCSILPAKQDDGDDSESDLYFDTWEEFRDYFDGPELDWWSEVEEGDE